MGLESYLKAINSAADSKWRETPAFKSFLNLPTNLSSTSSLASTLRSATDNTGNVSDPTVWLDVHRELKGVLHEARLHVAARDSSTVVSVGHEESAGAKKALVRAGTLISVLDKGLKGRQEEWGVEKLGEGEVRRRRDLVASARKEKETLEGLLITIARKKEVDEVVADKQSLVEGHHGSSFSNAVGRQGKQSVGKGRVLGKETSRTRELDNKGVLGLQQQMMKEQDEDVNILAEAVRRQKELSIQINEELAEQINMLDMLDEDVSRVDSKIKVARKRVDKIS